MPYGPGSEGLNPLAGGGLYSDPNRGLGGGDPTDRQWQGKRHYGPTGISLGGRGGEVGRFYGRSQEKGGFRGRGGTSSGVSADYTPTTHNYFLEDDLVAYKSPDDYLPIDIGRGAKGDKGRRDFREGTGLSGVGKIIHPTKMETGIGSGRVTTEDTLYKPIDMSFEEPVGGWTMTAYSTEEFNALSPESTNATLAYAKAQTSSQAGRGTGSVAGVGELQNMLTAYQGRGTLIQGRTSQKSVYTIDRFDGGLNTSFSPRDLSYWQACSMNELSPSKIGKLIRLGDFKTRLRELTDTDSVRVAANQNYGLHHFTLSSNLSASDTLQTSSPVPQNYRTVIDDNDADTNVIQNTSNDSTFGATTNWTDYHPDGTAPIYTQNSTILEITGGTATDERQGIQLATGFLETLSSNYYYEIKADIWSDNSHVMNDFQFDLGGDGTTTSSSGLSEKFSITNDIKTYTRVLKPAGDNAVRIFNTNAANTKWYVTNVYIKRLQSVHIVEDDSDLKIDGAISRLGTDCKPVIYSADNKIFCSDANFASSTAQSYVSGIIDRPSLYPIASNSAHAISYNISGNTASKVFKNQPLLQAPPVAGRGHGQICVTIDDTAIPNNDNGGPGESHEATGDDVGHNNGIFMQLAFSTTTNIGDGNGWAPDNDPDITHYYKIFASFLYDNGSESRQSDVTSTDSIHFASTQKLSIAGSADGHAQLTIKQCIIDATEFYTNFQRVHGARFYYVEVDSNAKIIGTDKYLFAELDFKNGLSIDENFSSWHRFVETSTDTAIQVDGANNTGTTYTSSGVLVIKDPPTAYTFFTTNLYNQHELKDDLQWKCSASSEGIIFIGNVKYDSVEYPDVLLYSATGVVGNIGGTSAYGVFPVDSNRFTTSGDTSPITALQPISDGRLLIFKENSLYVLNHSDIENLTIEARYEGMGISGQHAVTLMPFGVAWVNAGGVYIYDIEKRSVRLLTVGKIEADDFNADSDTKIGYDDRSRMLIIGNYTRAAAGTNGYTYAYSFVADAFCTWDTNKADIPHSNFSLNAGGYLCGQVLGGDVYQWSTSPSTAVAVEYITKDIDMNKPSVNKRLFTLYISYTGGTGQSGMNVYFRVNGKEGSDITNGWHQLETIQDYTDPYFTTNATAWNDSSGTPVTGNPTINISTGLNSTSTGEVQKLAKINLRSLGTTDTVDETDTGSTTFPKDYLKFARSVQFKIAGTASSNFEINDITLVYKDKIIK